MEHVRTDHEDGTYEVTYTIPATAGAPAFTVTYRGRKGPVKGDRRLDRVSMTVKSETGEVQSLPEREVAVLLTNPYEGMPEAEMLEALRRDWAAGKFGSKRS